MALALCFAFLLPHICACSSAPYYESPSLSEEMEKIENKFSYSGESGPTLSLESAYAENVYRTIGENRPVFEYEHLYETDKAIERLDFSALVDVHKSSALDSQGELDAKYLCGIVLENNAEYLADAPFGYSAVEEDYALEICQLITETVKHVLDKYPEIDRSRVYCNLGNLKILYKTGMLDFASVNPDMVMAVSNTSANIAEINKGPGAYRNIMIHETMHIIQIGCLCEDIGDKASRRCGICVYWGDWALNSADWGWLFEGGAERVTATYTNSRPLTYAYKVDYICTFNTALLLDRDVPCDFFETVCFYDDPELLFEAFGCESEDERREVVNAMITVNVLQMSPEAFYLEFEKEYGYRPDKDDDTFNDFCYSLKPAPCLTAAGYFYKNLTRLLCENKIGANDLCFLINSFESSLNMHMNFADESTAAVNEPFSKGYRAIRDAFFDAVSRSGNGVDMAELYEKYEMCDKEEQIIAASLSFLSEEERAFFLDRAQRAFELEKLAVKFK